MMSNGNHSVILHLAPELRSGVIKYMAKHDLDKEYAVLSLLLKAMRSESIITQETYEYYSSRYGKTVSSLSQNVQAKPLTPQELQRKQLIDEKKRVFVMIKEQWNLDHRKGWKDYWIKEAEKYSDCIPEAKAVVALAARIA